MGLVCLFDLLQHGSFGVVISRPYTCTMKLTPTKESTMPTSVGAAEPLSGCGGKLFFPRQLLHYFLQLTFEMERCHEDLSS